jgi:hypothetical protein
VVLDANHPGRVVSAGCHWSPGGSELAYAAGQPLSDVTATKRWTGPDSAVAFYRRSAMSEVGWFDATLSPGFAAIDLSLRLLHTGHRVMLEPASHVFLNPSLMNGEGPFNQAWQRERLFWRHARNLGLLRSIAAHGWLLLTETLKSIPRPLAVAHLAGRFVGACDTRGPRLQLLEPQPARAMDAPGAAIERRVDQGHGNPASPSRTGTRPSRTASQANNRGR